MNRFLKHLLSRGLPAARFLSGVAVGKLCFWLGWGLGDVLALAAAVPIVLGWLTEEWESEP